MSEPRAGTAFERVLAIVHEGLRGARENADEVRRVAKLMDVGFIDVVAAAIATEVVKAFELEDVNTHS